MSVIRWCVVQLVATVTIAITLVSSCGPTNPQGMKTRQDHGIAQSDSETSRVAVPSGLVADNFERAPIVVQVRISSVTIADTIRSDDGKIGYVRFQVSAVPLEIYKSDRGLGRELKYFVTEEFDPRWEQRRRPGDRRLIFITYSPEYRELHVIDEAADFPMDPMLLEQVRELASRK